MLQDRGVGAAGVFQGVGQDRQLLETLLRLDGLGQLQSGAVVAEQPVPGQPLRLKGIADQLASRAAWA